MKLSDTKVWNKSNLIAKSKFRHFPTDIMLRALFSDNYFNSRNIKTNGTVLDIGCLYANNLLPFSDRGWELFGTEVTEDSVEIAKRKCEENNLDAEIKLGFNTELPFRSNKFDVLLSIATIHYEETVVNVDNALKEMCRVIKDGGCAFITTAAPKHVIFENSIKIGENLYQLDMKSDLRHKQRFVFFDKADDLILLAKKYFTEVEVARCTETYPNLCVDLWLFKLKKN